MNQDIKDYLRNKAARTNMPWRYIGETGKTGYILAGVVLTSEQAVKEMFPMGEKITFWNFIEKGENPDKKRLY